MEKLVKRTVTEEFVERVDDDAEGLDDLEATDASEGEEPEDDDEVERPTKRSRRR